jgi:predicted ATPase/class 3 adenylate cyclase
VSGEKVTTASPGLPDLPTGTVTFLFTDIEGSTQLLQELGESYPGVQHMHSKIVRRALAEANGVEVRTEGDSFLVAFRRPTEAVRAATAAQRRLSAASWPHGRPLRVRMGIHTGEGIRGGDEYIGIDVNRAARIAAAAWGGQVILSEVTKVLVERALPENVVLRRLGVHRLKDLRDPEVLYDLSIEGVPSRFPPPRTLEVPTNLPAELASFVGREDDLARVRVHLPEARLLTLTGPGGTGKTRLALRIAAETTDFSDGKFFVDLAPVTDAHLVVPTIAATLGVREEGWEQPVKERLADHLRDRRLLLVLDNFEQVLDAAPVVTWLLAEAPHLTVLVTSRAPLHVQGEQVVRVEPMDVPDPKTRSSLTDLLANDAVALFVQRAAAVSPGFRLTEDNAAEVVELLSHLDGLPLAIELAASRATLLTPRSMLRRMERALPLLTGGARDLPARQRTLRATIGWSYELLEPAERILFRRLAVVAGGASLDAAGAVCGDHGIDLLDGLGALADRGLLRSSQEGDQELRFSMLQTIREFGLERLDAEDDRFATERRHAEWLLQLAETAEPELRGPEIERWLAALEVEHDNLRAALQWSIDSGEADIGLRLVGALWRFWHLGGHLSEGRRWASAVLSLPSAEARSAGRARALTAAGGLAYWQNDLPAVRAAYEEALGIAHELGDDPAVAEGTYNLGFAYGLVQRRTRARELFLESRRMFDRLGNRLGAADSMWALALLARLDRDHHRARRLAEESVRLLRELGDAFGLVDALGELGRAALELGDYEVARATHLEILDAIGPIGYRTAVAIVLDTLAALESGRGNPLRAMRLGGAAEALKESAGGQVPPEFADVPDPRARARSLVDEERLLAAWEEGRAMSLEEAVEYARAEPKPGEA